MRRMLGLAVACCLLLTVAVGPVVAGSSKLVDCRRGDNLQEAIDAASPGAALTITGTCVGDFVIDKDLTLTGRARNATLDGGGSGTTLRIPSLSVTVSIADLRITGGETGLEVGVAATVSVTRTWIGGNPGDGIGGGPRNELTVLDSIVQGNGRYGVSLTMSRLVMRSSIVRDNGADGFMTGLQSVVLLDDSVVMNNGGRGIFGPNSSITLDRSTVSGNADGGIYADTQSYLFVHGSTIAGNTTKARGGGLLVERELAGTGGLVIEDTTIANNTAGISGGGLYITKRATGFAQAELAKVRFVNNRAGTSGGGIDLVGGGVLALTDVTFRHNAPDDFLGC